MSGEQLAALAAEAFIYGFPLVFDLERGRPLHPARDGQRCRRRRSTRSRTRRSWPGPNDTFVSINNDTIYSIAQLDVSGGPVRLRRARHGRPLLRAAVRRRVDEQLRLRRPPRHRHRRPARSCSSPPGWDGAAHGGRDRDPAARPRSRRIVGRWAVDGEDDLPAVRALQARLTLTPTGDGDGDRAAGARSRGARGPRVLRAAARLDARRSRRRRATCDYQQRFEPLGLFDAGVAVRRSPTRELAGALRDGLAAGQASTWRTRSTHGRAPSGTAGT